jgi:hypothetical protein
MSDFQMVPAAAVAREPRGVEAQHRANLPCAKRCDQAIKARALDRSACSPPKIVDDFDVRETAPARDIDQLVLAPLALQIRLHLFAASTAEHRRRPCAAARLPEVGRHASSSPAFAVTAPLASRSSWATAWRIAWR